ncbi:MAG: MFS transporter [Spirochaetales bacterium]|nr:MFS transporter [Spirochaetales bacterium]
MVTKAEFRKNSILIIAGNSLTGFGNSMYLVALLVFVSTRFPHPLNIGLVQAAAYLPIVLFGIPAGFLADRSARVPVIAGTDLLRALFLPVCALALMTAKSVPPLAFIIPMLFLNGTMQAFFSPSVISFILDGRLSSVIEESPPRRGARKLDLLSLRTASSHLASLLGQAVGAGLYLVTGIVPILFINGATFLLSGISELFLTENRRATGPGKRKHSLGGLFRELRVTEARGAPVLLYLVSQAAGAAILVNLPFFLGHYLKLPPDYLGYAMAALLGGSIISAFLLGLTGSIPSTRSAYLAASLAAVSLDAAGFLPPGRSPLALAGLLPFLIVTGGATGWIHIVTIHAVHKLGEIESAASRQGFMEAAVNAVLPVSYLASGAVFEQLPLDTPWIIRSVGAGMMVLSGLLWFRQHRRAESTLRRWRP